MGWKARLLLYLSDAPSLLTGYKRCKGITKKKLQCLLPTSRPDGFCHHHKSQKPTTAPDRTTDRTTAERTTDEHPVPPQTPPHSGDETETDTARGEENFGSATEPVSIPCSLTLNDVAETHIGHAKRKGNSHIN
jgi:hypothetical protein